MKIESKKKQGAVQQASKQASKHWRAPSCPQAPPLPGGSAFIFIAALLSLRDSKAPKIKIKTLLSEIEGPWRAARGALIFIASLLSRRESKAPKIKIKTSASRPFG